MEIFELIKGDHRKVESLFAEMENTKSAKKLDQSFKQLCQELTIHAQVEELTFYPTMRDNKKTEKLVDEAEEEHVEVKVLLEQLKSLDSSSSEFKDKMSQLKQAVE
ncbi:MAG TPA: hemerythrin domain-containing protein, partial [Cyanophyceae cyanobacterium]